MSFVSPTVRSWVFPDEQDEFLSLYRECFPAKKITRETIRRVLNEPAQVWFAESAGMKDGFLYFWSVAGELQIIDIGTHPVRRRSGVARALLRELQSLAVKEAKKITLEVREGNLAARSLYEKTGFRRVGTRAAYYSDGEDAVLYEWV